MSVSEQNEIKATIAQIIERSRHQEEQFLIDSRAAAATIIEFLRKQNLVQGFFEDNLVGRGSESVSMGGMLKAVS